MDDKIKNKLEEYNILCQNLPDVVLLLDKDGKILFLAGQFQEMSGFSAKEMIGKNIFNIPLIAKEDLALVKKNFVRRLEGKNIPVYRIRGNTKKGGKLIVELSGRLIDFSGQKTVLFIIRDMTRAAAMEEESEEEHERCQILFNQAVVGIGIATLQGKILSANKAMEFITGYSIKELKNINVADIYVKKEDRDAVLQRLKKYGRVEHFEVDLLKKDKKLYKALLSVAFIKIKGEKFLQTTIVDITDIKLAEDKLRESEKKFRSIFENVGEGVVVVDIKTKKFIMANKKFCEMLGCKLEEPLGMSVLDIHPKESLPQVLRLFDALVRKEKAIVNEVPYKRKDGSIRYADIGGSVISLDGRDCLMGIFRDVTEQKEIKDVLNQKLREVERINQLFVGRELKMAELKKELAAIKKKLK